MKRHFLIATVAGLLGFAVGSFSSSVMPLPEGGQQAAGAKAPSADPPALESGAFATARAALAKMGLRGTLEDLAQLGEAMQSLDAAQTAKLLDLLERDSGRQGYDQMACVMRWWLKRDEKAANQWARGRLARVAQDGPLGMIFTSTKIGYLVIAWAREQPEEAFALARKYPKSGLALLLLKEGLVHQSGADVNAQLARLRDFPDSPARTEVMIGLLGALSRKSPASALDAAKAFPDAVAREKALASVLKSWPKADAATAFEHYQALGLNDDPTLRAILNNGIGKDPELGKQWLAVLEPEQFKEHSPEFVANWAKVDPVKAFTWAIENGVSLAYHQNYQSRILHNGIGSRSSQYGGSGGYGGNPMSDALKERPQQTLDWLRSLPAEQRARYTQAALIATPSPEAAMKVYESLPLENRKGASLVASRFTDVAKGRAWIETLPAGRERESAWNTLARQMPEPIELPPGSDRDAMLAGNVFRYGAVAPERTLPLISQIGDAEKRRDAFEEAMEHYIGNRFSGDIAEKTRAWMEKADLPEEWKHPWLVRPKSP